MLLQNRTDKIAFCASITNMAVVQAKSTKYYCEQFDLPSMFCVVWKLNLFAGLSWITVRKKRSTVIESLLVTIYSNSLRAEETKCVILRIFYPAFFYEAIHVFASGLKEKKRTIYTLSRLR